MKLTKPTENLLLLDVELEHTMFRFRWYFIGSLPIWIIFNWLRTISINGGWGEYALIAGRLVTFTIVFLSLLLGLMLLTDSLDHPVEKCAFDKSLKRATLFKRVMWRLWKEETEHYSLKEIISVKLRPNEHKAVLELNLENGKTINLGTETGKGQISEIAEEISQYLNIPFQIRVGSQQIDKYYRGELHTHPLLCSRCGGQLSAISEQTTQVSCEYCGTIAMLTWENDRVLVQTAI